MNNTLLKPRVRRSRLAEHEDPARKYFVSLREFIHRTGMGEDAVRKGIRDGEFYALHAHGELLLHVNALHGVLERANPAPEPSLWADFLGGTAPLEDAFWFWGAPALLVFLSLFQLAPILGVPPMVIATGTLLYFPLHGLLAASVWRCQANVKRRYWRPIVLAIVAVWTLLLYAALTGDLSEPLRPLQ